MNLVLVIASQVHCPVLCLLVVMQPHLQISLQPWGPCGAPKACSQEQAVLWDQFCCFCSLCPLEEQGPGARPVSALLVRLWGLVLSLRRELWVSNLSLDLKLSFSTLNFPKGLHTISALSEGRRSAACSPFLPKELTGKVGSLWSHGIDAFRDLLETEYPLLRFKI